MVSGKGQEMGSEGNGRDKEEKEEKADESQPEEKLDQPPLAPQPPQAEIRYEWKEVLPPEHERQEHQPAQSEILYTYSFPSSSLTFQEWQHHRSALTFYPESEFMKRKNPFFKPKPLCLWSEHEQNGIHYCSVPPLYGLATWGKPIDSARDLRPQGMNIIPERADHWETKLWDDTKTFNQEIVMQEIFKHVETEGCGGILHLPTSSGKTVMATYLIHKLHAKTLVIVPGKALLTQWVSRLQHFLPHCRIGIIQGSKCQIEGCDIVIAMLQSLSMKDNYPRDRFHQFKMVFVDECHKNCAREFSKSFRWFSHVRLIFGLSATTQRIDGLDAMLRWCIGPMIYVASPVTAASIVTSVRSIFFYGGWQKTKLRGNDVDFGKSVKWLFRDPYRNGHMMRLLADLFHHGRSTLFMSGSVVHLRFLEQETKKRWSGTKKIVRFAQNLKPAERKTVDDERHDLILATPNIFGTGLDVDYLDTIVLGSPCKQIEQMVGRLRAECKRFPRQPLLILDFTDMFGCFLNQRKRRTPIYKKKKFIILPNWIIPATEVEQTAQAETLKRRQAAVLSGAADGGEGAEEGPEEGYDDEAEQFLPKKVRDENELRRMHLPDGWDLDNPPYFMKPTKAKAKAQPKGKGKGQGQGQGKSNKSKGPGKGSPIPFLGRKRKREVEGGDEVEDDDVDEPQMMTSIAKPQQVQMRPDDQCKPKRRRVAWLPSKAQWC